MKKKIDNIFVRIGRLHLTKQKGFGGDSFHSPPSPIGFYAMPYRFQEIFLVGSVYKTQSKQVNIPKKLQTDEILKIEDNEERNELWVKREAYMSKKMFELTHKFNVNDNVYVWHHLKSPHNEIIDTHGSWIKTTMFEYRIALKKENIKLRAESLKYCDKKDINSVSKMAGCCSKDHFEVFFDTKVV